MRHLSIGFLLLSPALAVWAGEWKTEGFEAFRRGTFGNAGHNLYVSRAGVLQRIFQYDLDHNGWFDIVFANCQNHHESAPSYVYDAANGARKSSLLGQGARSGAVADLDGDGIQDLVVTGYHDMVTPFACADIYYGRPDGTYDECYHIRIQSPRAVGTAVGRFDGGKRPSIAFAIPEFKLLRVYRQTELGFEWGSFKDYPAEAEVLSSGDFDGDGFDDLAFRLSESTATTVWWGSADGFSTNLVTEIPARPAEECRKTIESVGYQSDFEKAVRPFRQLETALYNGKTCFTLSTGRRLLLYSMTKDRSARIELDVPVDFALSCATADFNGDGLTDLVIAREKPADEDDDRQQSWLWLNSPDGFVPKNILPFTTVAACSVSVLDDLVLVGQGEANGRYTNDAILFRYANGKISEQNRFEGEDMRRVFLFRNARGEPNAFLVNHFARSSVGFDKSFVYWGREGGRYAPEDRTEVPSWCAVDSVCADLDDDGWAELLICNNSENSLHLDPGHHIHHFGPKGFEPSRSFTLKTDIGWGTAVADFNRDGYLDILTVTDLWSTLSLYEGGPDGFRRVQDLVIKPVDPEVEAKAAAGAKNSTSKKRWRLKRETFGALRWPIVVDVNNDGWLDVVCGIDPKARSFVLFGGPKGFDLSRRQDLAAYAATGVRAADLDGNGYPELIFGGHCSQPYGKDYYRQPHHSYLFVYWNSPEGLSESRKCMLRADAASHLCVGDLNGDGSLDIFACSYQGDVDRDINSFIYWNRSGKFTAYDRQDLVTHSTSGSIAVDFNEDGRLDLAVANHKVFGDHTGYSEVWWNTDEGFLPSRTTKLPTFGPHGITAIEPGNALTRGPEEFYYSEPRVAETDLTVDSATVEGEVPPKCWTKIELRADDGAWSDPAGFAAKKGARLQYRLTLGAKNALRSPRITAVDIRYHETQR